MRRDKLLSFALIFVILQLLLAIFAPIVAGDPIEQVIMSRMQGPSLENPLGTDQLGRDVFARILFGYRTSLLTCGVAVVLALIVGGSLGMLAAFYRGWFDRIVMRIMDVLFAFPIILLAIGIIAVLGPNALSASIAIGVVYVPIFARLLRGPSLVICESEYVQGARAIGASDSRIVFTHLLPNLSSLILVQASLLLSAAILVEASLSFLGLGAQPPTPSLGQMLSEGRNFLLLNPWPAVFSGFAILFLSFGFNLLGDALRDTLDPRLRNSTD
ncbi:ABC transporter permease [Ponticoccus sp. SC2-23]|nr:ABC transporter permease [Ponticoccus sp. SC6-9]MBM1224319.1 ABC transporter permease [Ponticoccus sp. SC6-15]MBM1229902.1 ABC transporter permease [Ponticoccus sp. SC6-38]MBM1236765.1 ABC transporter permease [Ponticoccus sp. SC6-49]MBM1242296.1 ABC transporter permease [Ponticoccus sp. SC2-64]MBM1246809.1 ABC transporter permease [Ponticoccus sp. SC6-42]MBM1251287.1 ABC transporter permease [Ponticoccus sp. SC6-33]MBM1254774.1 ABC transporter permease [Ponticoccus sp. SC6-60]MBM1259280